MSRGNRQTGMAVALVLWLIAAMGLTVAAIIHFSRGDTEAIAFRVQQSQADAAGRGAALVLLRDQNLALQSLVSVAPGSEPNSAEMFKKNYRFDDLIVTATVVAGNKLVSLNDASPATLLRLFESVGQASLSQAQLLTESVVSYRTPSSVATFDAMYHPGFRYREELLMMQGITRGVYDRVRPWVHPFHTGDTDVGGEEGDGTIDAFTAGFSMGGELTSSAGVEEGRNGQPQQSAAAGSGRLTFDSMYANMAAQQSAQAAPALVSIETTFPDGSHYHQLVWVDTVNHQIVRAPLPRRLVAE